MFDMDHKASPVDFAGGRLDASDPWSRAGSGDESTKGKRVHPLDSVEEQGHHTRLKGVYESELDRQGTNRADMARDEDFYDNLQWREDDAQELKERGQVPLVYNVISSSVNWVIGTEKRGRTDYKVLPRRADAGKPAERKSQLMKYLSDVNRSPFARSRAFEDCVKVGIGWLEVGSQDESDGEAVVVRYESWRNVLWDSASHQQDLSDCRYVFRTKWVDLDVAIAMFPDRKGILTSSVNTDHTWSADSEGDEVMDSMESALNSSGSNRSFSFEYQRERVRLIECWYLRPTQAHVMIGGDFNGELFDVNDPAPAHVADIEAGNARAMPKKAKMTMHVGIFCSKGMLYHDVSPYRHNRFPFTPIWCYRRGRDGQPYGMIRGMRDIQEDINKRASKALWILSSNKTIMDEGAVDDLDTFAEEVARPDAIIVKKAGKQLELNADRELAPAHLDLMQRSISMIQSLSGVTDENMGRKTNATSGIAIQSRQEQGSMSTAGIFDNLRYAVQVHGEKELAMIEQYFTEEKMFRITNMRGTPQYISVNDGTPENDITRTKADYVISEEDWRATVRQAQTQELLELLQQLAPVAPQMAITLLDLVVESMDVPSREEIVKRIRQQTGMRDPDAPELTPEEQQAEAAKQALQQKQQELQMRDAEATIQGKEARAQRDATAAQKDQASIKQILSTLAGTNVDTQAAAIAAAFTAVQNPGIVPVADRILHESGFTSRTEDEHNQAAQAEAEQQAQLQQQQAEQQQQAAAQQQLAEQQQQADQQHQQAAQEQQQQQQPAGMGLGVASNPQ